MPRESSEVPFFPDPNLNVWAGYQHGIIASAEVDENFHFQPHPLPYQMQQRPFRPEVAAPPARLFRVNPMRAVPSAPVLPLVRQPLAGVDVNVLTMAREIGALEAQNTALARENGALKKHNARQEVLITAFCDYHMTRGA